MQKLLPYGVVVAAVGAAGFLAALLVSRSSANARPAPAVHALKLASSPAIQQLSAHVAALPLALAVVERVPPPVTHSTPPASQSTPPASHFTPPVSRSTPSVHSPSPPAAHPTTTIIIQGGSG